MADREYIGEPRGAPEPEPLSAGKQTLLRALDQINEIEQDDHGQVKHLVVTYAVQHKPEDEATYTTVGWASTDDPSFIVAALLKETALLVDGQWRDATSEDEEDDE